MPAGAGCFDETARGRCGREPDESRAREPRHPGQHRPRRMRPAVDVSRCCQARRAWPQARLYRPHAHDRLSPSTPDRGHPGSLHHARYRVRGPARYPTRDPGRCIARCPARSPARAPGGRDLAGGHGHAVIHPPASGLPASRYPTTSWVTSLTRQSSRPRSAATAMSPRPRSPSEATTPASPCWTGCGSWPASRCGLAARRAPGTATLPSS